MTDIRKLFERAQQGDREAFALMFESFRGCLLDAIDSRLGPTVRQGVDPGDVLQDTFIVAHHSFDRFRWKGEDGFRAWLKSIADRVTKDVVQRQSRRHMLFLEGHERGEGTSPSRGVARRDRLHRLEKALETLSPDHRSVLLLARIEGLSIADIARRMDRSESAVKNLLLRAMKHLRVSFGETESLNLGSGRLGRREDSHGG